MARVPRTGFMEAVVPSANLGRGPTYKHSLRLAYGPGPAGSFDTPSPGQKYSVPPVEVYKERSTYFYLPKRDPYKIWTPPPSQPGPLWAERLSLTKGQLAQLGKTGTVPGRMLRPNSAPNLLMVEAPASPLPAPKPKLVLSCGGAYLYTPSPKLALSPKPSRPPSTKTMDAKAQLDANATKNQPAKETSGSKRPPAATRAKSKSQK